MDVTIQEILDNPQEYGNEVVIVLKSSKIESIAIEINRN